MRLINLISSIELAKALITDYKNDTKQWQSAEYSNTITRLIDNLVLYSRSFRTNVLWNSLQTHFGVSWTTMCHWFMYPPSKTLYIKVLEFIVSEANKYITSGV